MQIAVRFFAGCRDAAQADTTMLVLPDGAGLSHLKEALADRYPKLARYVDRIRYSVNWEYVSADAELHDGDEVALIPPVAGGAEG